MKNFNADKLFTGIHVSLCLTKRLGSSFCADSKAHYPGSAVYVKIFFDNFDELAGVNSHCDFSCATIGLEKSRTH